MRISLKKEAMQRLKNRKIVNIKMNKFKTGRGNETSTDPHIYLDDGSFIWFVVEETDTGDYGIALCISDSSDLI